MRRASALILAAWAIGAVAPVRGDDPEPPAAAEAGDGPVQTELTEKVVVSASATAQALLDAPAAVDVLESDDLQARPGDQLVDQLRRVPGINVVQFSARDVNIASRSATGGINNSTLVLADGRSLYQDFLGFVMWEFAPTDLSLVERVEVVRGPASALWGANAVGGLIHVITKSPRDTLGGQVELEAGSYATRRVEFRESFLAGPWALRVGGALHRSDPFDRPETIENFLGETVDPDLGLLAEDFRDSGTEQPRLDVRADWEGDGAEWILQAGWGRTRGWIATGLGPFDIDPGTSMSYVQARYRLGPLEAAVNANFLDGDAQNLVNEIPFAFTSGSTQATLHGAAVLGRRAVLGWGVDLDRSTYDLSIAPDARHRTHQGVFSELNLELSPRFSLVAAGRVDHFQETIGAAFSPRVALRFKPTQNQTLRASVGRAFRSPSVIETDLDVPSIPVAILNWAEVDQQLIDDGLLDPQQFPDGLFELMAIGVCATRPDNCGAPIGEAPDYVAITAASGSRAIDEEITTAYEVGYAGRYGKWGLSASLYQNRSRDGISFLQVGTYGVGPDGVAGTADDVIFTSDPDGDGIEEAPAVDVCPFGLELFSEPVDFASLCALGPVTYNQALAYFLDGLVPSSFRYGNGPRQEDRGVELGLTWDAPRDVSLWLNYSWQGDPRTDGVKMRRRIASVIAEREAGSDLDGDGLVGDINAFANIPASHRVSLGAQLDRTRWFGGVTLDWVDRTFWQDIQTSDFWGWVPSYTLVGLRGGWRWPGRGLELTGQVTNLLDEPIRQHILGDIIGLRATVGLGFSWDRPGPSPNTPVDRK